MQDFDFSRYFLNGGKKKNTFFSGEKCFVNTYFSVSRCNSSSEKVTSLKYIMLRYRMCQSLPMAANWMSIIFLIQLLENHRIRKYQY